MAEKEACADLISSVTADLKREQGTTQSNAEGESLLLPLLQGLLLNKKAQNQQLQQLNSCNKLPIPPVEDSGTESGEDLRLLAAGLHDNIELYRGGIGNGDGNLFNGVDNTKTNDSGGGDILAEVAAALGRLQNSLRDGHTLHLDNNKKNTLLTLVSRLQTGLMSPEKIPEQVSPVQDSCDNDDDKADYVDRGRRNSGRFSKRKNRNNRHTVGVSKEELADARAYVEDMLLRESVSKSPEKPPPKAPEFPYALQKQRSVGTALGTGTSFNPLAQSKSVVLMRPSEFIPKENPPLTINIKAANKPNDLPILHTAPVVHFRDKKPKFKAFRQSLSLDSPKSKSPTPQKEEPKKMFVDNAPKKAFPIGNNQQKYSFDASSSEEDEIKDNSKPLWVKGNAPVINTVQKIVSREVREIQLPKSAPPISRRFSKSPEHHHEEKPVNKYSSKKARMKRANTIDIAKPIIPGGESDIEDSDAETLHAVPVTHPVHQKPEPKPVQLPKINDSNKVHDIRSKSENGQKFAAFLQKQNEPRGWNNPAQNFNNKNNWSDKFGVLLNNFEKNVPNKRASPILNTPKNNAMNFWKKVETPETKEPVKNKKDTLPWCDPKKPPINHAPKQQPKPNVAPVQNKPQAPNVTLQNKSQPPANKLNVQKPTPVNQFSHAPMSAFKPIPRKIQPEALTFKPLVHPEPVKPIPQPVNSVVKQMAATGFASSVEEKSHSQPIPASTGLVKQIAAAGFKEHEEKFPVAQVPYVPQSSSLVKQMAAAGFKEHNEEKIPSFVPPSSNLVKQIAAIGFSRDQVEEKRPIPQQPPPASTGLVKQIVAAGFNKETVEEKHQSIQPVSSGLVKQMAAQGYKETPYIPPPRLEKSPTRTVLNYQPKTDEHPVLAPPVPWAGKSAQDGTRVANIVAATFDHNQFGHSSRLSPRAPLSYHGSFEDYPIPPLIMNRVEPEDLDNDNSHSSSYFSPPAVNAQPSNFTFTDFTHPTSVSTFAPPEVRPVLNRYDSLTNPSHEPLVLSNTYNLYVPPENAHLSIPHHDYLSSTSISHNLDDDDDDDLESLPLDAHEYRAVSKVKEAPVYQHATVSANKVTNRNNDILIAQSLQNSLMKFSKSPTPLSYRSNDDNSYSSLNSAYYTPPQQNSLIYNPPKIAVIPNTPEIVPSHAIFNHVPGVPMRRSSGPSPPKFNPLQRAKSGHTLTVPSFNEKSEKEKTMVAYFAGQNRRSSPNPQQHQQQRPVSFISPSQPTSALHRVSSINRKQTHEKSAYSHNTPSAAPIGLSRSRTMPHIPLSNLRLLDEDNVEDAFEELLMSSFS